MIPSLLQIPSAVSDSKLHSVLPNNGKGDFQFERSTGATRINRDGLIEEVGYFSSELVQNGNFSELGSEAVTNGDFATDSNWAKGTGWVIMNGYAESDGTNAPLDQVSVLTVGKTYKVVITVTNMTSSALSVRLGTSSSDAVLSILENGTYTAYGVAGATTFRLRSQGFDGRIQNVSVKQVDPNDRWTVSGVDIALDTNGIKLTTNDSSNGGIYQAVTTVVGSNYRLKLDFVAGNVNGIVQIGTSVFGGELYQNTSVTSNLIINFTATTTTTYINLRVAASGATDKHCFYNNVSIVEVQGDRPRLSYDITNGVVEDKPHLLLEPSSTNLVTFSEDLSQWANSFSTDESNVAISPQGIQNAGKLIDTTSTGDHYISTQNVSIAYDTVTANSIFVKKGTFNHAQVRLLNGTGTFSYVIATFNLDTGELLGTLGSSGTANTSYKIEKYPNDWWRIILVGSFTNSNVTARRYSVFLHNGTTQTYTGTGNDFIYVWGGQIEAQTYATSYIPTAGTTITRAAETCNNSKPSVNSTEGVLYCEVAALADDLTYRVISISAGSSSNAVRFNYDGSANNKILANFKSGGVTTASLTFVVSDITSFTKVALKWKANDFALWVDGSERATDTSGSAPIGLNQIAFDNANGADDFYGKVKGLAVYNEALSESQLMQLTGVTASSIYSNFVTRTASFTVEALNEVKKVIDNL